MKLLNLLALTCLAALNANALQLAGKPKTDDSEARFTAWTAQYNKSYKSDEERSLRFSYWIARDQSYKEINSVKGNSFTVGHNYMSDFSEDEINAMLNGIPETPDIVVDPKPEDDPVREDPPVEDDPVVDPVKEDPPKEDPVEDPIRTEDPAKLLLAKQRPSDPYVCGATTDKDYGATLADYEIDHRNSGIVNAI